MNETQPSGTSKYLTFTLNRKPFAVETSKVREVVDYVGVTEVPRMPKFLPGVFNLRGGVVSMIDLGLLMDGTEYERAASSCVIIVEVDIDGERLRIGVKADAVRQVIQLSDDLIDPAPAIGTKLNTEYIRGVGKYKNEFLIIIDIEKILTRLKDETDRTMAKFQSEERSALQRNSGTL